MSYETSPILNRIKIRKGWKNPLFPLKTLHYSHEIILWFKLYLLLKNYLFLQKIMVLACEIRLSENYKKILYLSVTKQFQKKKLPKSKWKSKSLLREIKSPLTKLQNKKARFLLYQDLKTFKKNSSFFLNSTQKKILSKAWTAKPRFSSWVNLTKINYRLRKKTKDTLYLTRKNKKKILFRKNRTLGLHNGSFQNHLEEKIFGKDFFWKQKQKKILGLLSKTQKELFFIEKNFSLISNWQRSVKGKILAKNSIKKELLKNFLATLTLKYRKQKRLINTIQKLYFYLIQTSDPSFSESKSVLEKKLTQEKWKSFQQRKIQEKRRRLKLKFFWRVLKKQFWIKQTKNFSFSKTRKDFSRVESNFFQKTQKYRLMHITEQWKAPFLLNAYLWKIQSFWFRNSILDKKNGRIYSYTPFFKRVWKKNFRVLNALAKTQFLQKKIKVLPWQLMQLLRFKQQARVNFLKKNTQKKSYVKTEVQQLSKKKKKKIFLSQKYRLPFGLLYKNHLTLWTGFRLTYLLQNMIQKYFGLHFVIKVSWPLVQFKNLKFYRLLFPNFKPLNSEANFQEKSKNIKLKTKKKHTRNRYLYVGQTTKHLQLRKDFLQLQKKSSLFRKLEKRRPIFKETLPRTTLYSMNLNEFEKKNKIQDRFLTKSQKQPLKKNPYLILKSKKFYKKSQNRLFWAAKTPDMSNFLTTLTLFSKYLDPQPLADHLAKFISQSKNHSFLIKFVEKIIHTIQMKRGVGYRIALIGRIDGANKSRTLYLKKLNRSRARQNFSKNVNFAMAQARASIGVFSLKIWIYF